MPPPTGSTARCERWSKRRSSARSSLNLERRDQLDALVAALLEHETLDGKDVMAILGPSSRDDYEAGVVPQQQATIEATVLDNGKVHGEASIDGNQADDSRGVCDVPCRCRASFRYQRRLTDASWL